MDAGSVTGGAAGAGGAAGMSGAGRAAGASGTGGAAGTGMGTGGAAGTDLTDGSAGSAGAIDAQPETPRPVGAVFAVGSFSALPSTGMQVVAHPLGHDLKALILWTVARTNEVTASDYYYGIGVSDMSASIALAASSKDEVSPSSSSRRMAPKAMTLVQWGEVTVAEADLVSSNSSTFTLNWTVSNGQSYIIHYIAIGGPQVAAKLVNWQTPMSPSAKAVTGVGFQPEAVLHFHAGSSFVGAPPLSMTNAVVGIGAMDTSGLQWAIQSSETSGVTTSVATRAQRTSAAVYMYSDSSPASVTKEASIASMNPDGFTLNFTTANTDATQVYSLALAGLKARAATFDKTTATEPASQSVVTAFQPGALFLASYQKAATSGTVRESIYDLGIGASDGVRKASSTITAAHGVQTTATNCLDKTSKVFLMMNQPPLDGEADLTSFDPNGFTLNWTMNDAVASQICFLALGAP